MSLTIANISSKKGVKVIARETADNQIKSALAQFKRGMLVF